MGRERGKKHVTPRDAEGAKSVAQNAPRNTGGLKSIKGLFSLSLSFFFLAFFFMFLGKVFCTVLAVFRSLLAGASQTPGVYSVLQPKESVEEKGERRM